MITVHSVSEYLARNDFRRNATAIISGGLMTFLVDGERISEEEFNERYPITEYTPYNEKGVNVCKNRNFINNIKSF